jgi:hypothetical protein
MDINWLNEKHISVGGRTINTDQIPTTEIAEVELAPGEYVTFFPDGSLIYKPFIPLFVGGIDQ